MGIINSLLRAATWPAHQQLLIASRNMPNAQSKVWDEVQDCLQRSTYWGSSAKGRKLEDFPISDYETYRATLDALQNQKVSSLSGDEIIYWAESGGTSGPAKVFPLTKTYQKQFQRTMGPFLHANASRFAGFADKPIIYLASLLPQRKSQAGIDTGYISIFNYQNIPGPLKKIYAFPIDVFKTPESFEELAPLYAAATDISAMFAITPAKVEQFWELIFSHRERVLKTLAINPKLASKERLAHIDKIFNQSNPSLKDFWPSLRMVGCWKTASCALQLTSLEKILQNQTPVADAIYSATEGWMTVPLDGETGGVFHAGAHIVEFHEADSKPSEATLLKPWQLEVGKDYEVFLTTAMGFVRYRLYDVVRCTRYWNGAPVLEFKRKAGNQISLGTMRVTEDELITCMQAVGFTPKSPFRYAPNKNGNGLVFVTADESEANSQTQLNIDRALQDLSFYYRRDINAGVVKPIEPLVVPSTHKIWKVASHAQEKPRILLQEFPS